MTHERGTVMRSVGPVAGAVLLAIIALAMHPHLTGHRASQAELLNQLSSLSARDQLVHGTLLLLLGVLLTGFARYAIRRGLTRQAVLIGLITFAIGISSLLAAGLIDGFILPGLVSRFVAASPAVEDAAIVTLSACSVAVNVMTAFGIVAMAIAIGAWSFDLARDLGEARIAGFVGFGSATSTVAVLAMGGPSLTPHTLITVLCAQGVWYIWIAVLLARKEA